MGAGQRRADDPEAGRMSRDTGVTVRHARACASRAGEDCNCTPTYQARAYDAQAGKRIVKTHKTAAAARRWKRDAEVAIERGEISADRGARLDDIAAQWVEDARNGYVRNRSGDEYKPAAIRGYEYTLRVYVLPALGKRRLREITTNDVQTMIDDLVRSGISSASVDTALTPLRAIYRRAVARGKVAMNPTIGIEKPAVRTTTARIVSPVDAARMLEVLTAQDRPLWASAFYSGLRRGELTAQTVADVDLAARVIHVRRGWDAIEGEIAPKSKHGARKVPIPQALRPILAAHLPTVPAGGRVYGSPGTVRSTIERAADTWKAAGLPVATMHEARHTYASLMIAAGVNAKTLSTLMGHGSIAITMDLYGHLMPGAEDEAAALLDAYLTRHSAGDEDIEDRPNGAPTGAQSAQTKTEA